MIWIICSVLGVLGGILVIKFLTTNDQKPTDELDLVDEIVLWDELDDD